MKTTTLLIAILSALAVASHAADITLTGTFNRGKEADAKSLKAVLTPDGKDIWKVTYEADWKGKPAVYTGKLTGDIKNGAFTGDAVGKDGKRTWTVEGQAVNGKLTFDHFETTKGGKARTGSATLE
jgi:hypothetical protein